MGVLGFESKDGSKPVSDRVFSLTGRRHFDTLKPGSSRKAGLLTCVIPELLYFEWSGLLVLGKFVGRQLFASN